MKQNSDVARDAPFEEVPPAAIAPQRLGQEYGINAREMAALYDRLSVKIAGNQQQLEKLEQSIQEVSSETKNVLEVVHSFEAILSVGMVQRLTDLIDQRLTVASNSVDRLRRARRNQGIAAVVSVSMTLLLILEVYDGRVTEWVQTIHEITPNVLSSIGRMIA